jgi:hypothetical protein
MNAFVTANTKRVAVCILVSFGLVSQALAVLRPLFPAKPAPPFSGEGIVKGYAAYYTLLRGDLSHVFARSQAAFGALHGWQMRQTMARDMIVPAFSPPAFVPAKRRNY